MINLRDQNWLDDVFTEVREQVAKWPEWKRSDEVRKALRELNDRANGKPVTEA